MYRTLALTTALTVFTALLAPPATAANAAQLLIEEHYREAEYAVDLYVTRSTNEALLSEATITDPANGGGTEINVWTDGAVVGWHGMIEGVPVEGSMPAPDVTREPPPPQPLCFTPVTAIICLGVLVVAAGFSRCAHTKSICRADPTTEVPDGGGGVPPAPEDGGDGDGDGEGEGGSSAGGDKD